MSATRAGGARAAATLLALAGVLAALPPPAAAQEGLASALTAEERAWIEAHGPIRYGFNRGFAPFTLVDEHGAVRGINRDLLRLMSVSLGLEFAMVETGNFSQTLAAVSSGTVDVVGNLGATPERERTMTFTTPYAHVETLVWTREDRDVPADLADARLAVVRGTASVPVAEAAWPRARIVPVDEVDDGLAALRAGDVDAFLGADAPVSYLLLQRGWFDVVARGEPLDTRAFSFAVPSNETVLLGILEKGLAAIPREERARIFVRWTGRDLNAHVPPPPAVPLRTVVAAAGVVLLLAVAVGAPAWIAALRRRVARQTAEFRELNATLEARVAERTADLERANRELEAFSYSVSHDLRAPLRAIDGFSQSLLADVGPRLDDSGRRDLARIRMASQRMGNLIDDVLVLSRASRANPVSSDVDVSRRATHILDALRARDPDRVLESRVEPGLHVRADPGLLDTVLGNLLGNAWKFTSRTEHAVVEVGRVATPKGDAFFVRDNGAGFDPEFAGKLFTPFQRLHAERDFPGTGIGLASAKRIVERHGGEIWAEGAPGEGATFYFTIPGSGPP